MPDKNILYLTINFPPNQSVGTHRVAKILKYIDHRRFHFSVLTLKEKYYSPAPAEGNGNDKKIPPSVQVYRTDRSDLTYVFTALKQFAKNILSLGLKSKPKTVSKPVKPPRPKQTKKNKSMRRHLNSLRAVIFSVFEFPDKYIGWLPRAIQNGRRIIRDNNIDVILTTAPPHSLFIIALILKKMTGVKLVLDYRDPWALSRWDKGSAVKTFFEQKFERLSVNNAHKLLFVTENLRAEYMRHYQDQPTDKFVLFSNGYDPDDFNMVRKVSPKSGEAIQFVHLGTLYKKRNPLPFIEALGKLKSRGQLEGREVQMDFIGNVATELNWLPEKVKMMGLEKEVRFLAPVSFRQSLESMYAAGVLVIIQPGTDLQIPAKLFEYMYTRKPILAIAERNSATENVINEGRLGISVPPDDPEAILDALEQMILDPLAEPHADSDAFIERFNMCNYITELERCLDAL